jgi:hypothetical protein
MPARHVWSEAHAWPHAPQLDQLVSVGVHESAPGHPSEPGGQSVVQVFVVKSQNDPVAQS